jgi:hypothetical protein
MSCEINADIFHNCENPPIAGQRDRVIILPRRIITGATYNSTYSNIIESITKQSNKRAYEYVGTSKLIKSDKGMINDENGVRYRHRVPFVVYGNTPIIKAELESLAKENMGVVAILQQNYKGTAGNAKYEVFGWDVGLRLNLLEDVEGRNQYTIELTSLDGFEEPRLPYNIFDTTEATTDGIVEGLLTATSP